MPLAHSRALKTISLFRWSARFSDNLARDVSGESQLDGIHPVRFLARYAVSVLGASCSKPVAALLPID